MKSSNVLQTSPCEWAIIDHMLHTTPYPRYRALLSLCACAFGNNDSPLQPLQKITFLLNSIRGFADVYSLTALAACYYRSIAGWRICTIVRTLYHIMMTRIYVSRSCTWALKCAVLSFRHFHWAPFTRSDQETNWNRYNEADNTLFLLWPFIG